MASAPENLIEQSPGQPNAPKSFLKGAAIFVAELVEIIAISLAIIIPVRYFLVQPFYVKGASMEPNFYDGEYLIIDELSYRLREPKRGEVVILRYPLDPRQYFIKRIIGLPGETVTIGNGKILILNDVNPGGIFLDEKEYLSEDIYTYGEITTTLDGGEYLVLGDNRRASLDSRSFGTLNEKLIIGRVWFRGWPVERVASFEKPVYAGLE